MAEPEILRIKSTCTKFISQPPCCLAFSPEDPSLFVVGTYTLREKSSDLDHVEDMPVREGSLILCRLSEDDIQILQTLSHPNGGILDLKFSGSRIVVSTSTGSISIFALDTTQDPTIILMARFQVAETDNVITSFSFGNGANSQRIAFTSSTGRVSHLIPPWEDLADKVATTGTRYADCRGQVEEVYTHDSEAWITTFAPASWSLNGRGQVFSGGDDAVVQCSAVGDDPELLFKNRRIHGAGVTAVLPLDLSGNSGLGGSGPHFILTGSYDDTIRLLRIDASRPSPQVVAEMLLDGGVWSINILELGQDPISRDKTTSGEGTTVRLILLLGLMYAGSAVLSLSFSYSPSEPNTGSGMSAEYPEFKLLHKFEEHESMCYASKAQPMQDGGDESTRQVVSCSFYDRRLCLWRWRHGPNDLDS